MILDWYDWLGEPVRLKPGLRAELQHSFEAPPRLLPTPNVTGVMRAFETGKDFAEFGIYLYNQAQSAKVSLVQIPAIGGGNVAIED